MFSIRFAPKALSDLEDIKCYVSEDKFISIIRVLYARRDYLVLLAPDANMKDSQRS